jgi:hypothetical protein
VLSLGCFIFKTKLSQLWLYNVITVLWQTQDIKQC